MKCKRNGFESGKNFHRNSLTINKLNYKKKQKRDVDCFLFLLKILDTM